MEDKQRIERRNRRLGRSNLTDRAILFPALGDTIKKLNPLWMVRNPVMFVVEVGSVITTVVFVLDLFNETPGFAGPNNELFVGQIAAWLWLTGLFANFAEAVAEGRGKAQAAALRRTRSDTIARRVVDGREERVPSTQLKKG
ncbi:MAG TPA: potassium-transporting ATPase subunit B, partial [Candidatus Dormibacteraeota bacterium]|nr:potassium-transporting ATPase subunit B [Candidatus Dormibacteraeota bacterium]